MELSKRTKLLLQLEEIVAKHCNTKNLKNGRNYRYPIHYAQNGKRYVKRGKGIVNITTDSQDTIGTMEYRFVSHTLEIGYALDEILDFLEMYCEFDPNTYIDDEYDGPESMKGFSLFN